MVVKKIAKKRPTSKAKPKKVAKKTLRKPALAATRKRAKKAVKKAARRISMRSATVGKVEKPRQTPAATLKRTEFLKKLLLKKRNAIVAGLEEQLGRKLSQEPGQKIDSAMDNADLSSLDMDEGVNNSLMEMKYEQYKDIADAFRKLQSGTYGLCEECGEEIDVKRLEVNPFARYCIACKSRLEEFEKIQRETQRFKEQ